MLHYFPPVVAGVLVPTLVVIALIVIPYFNINVEAEGVVPEGSQASYCLIFYAGPRLRFRSVPCLLFDVYVALVPTLIVAGFMVLAAQSSPQSHFAFPALSGCPNHFPSGS